ncbi:hypothetical protein F1880_006626 [Penicillium rolfsii]|nr:hypothetical protein F1880_006626 [Penicillium rolfsii]
MAGSEKRNHQYLFSSASSLQFHPKARSYWEVRLVLKARLIETVVDDLCNSAYFAEKDSIRGADSTMSDNDAYVWSWLGFASPSGILPFAHHLAAPTNMFWAFVVQKASVTGPAVNSKLAGPGVFGMRDTVFIAVNYLLMSESVWEA